MLRRSHIIERVKALLPLHRFYSPIGDAVFVVVVAVTYAAWTVSASAWPTPLDAALMSGAGVAYAFVGTAGFARCRRARSLAMDLAYFAVQLTLVATAMIASHAPALFGWMLMPLAAHTAALPRRWALIVCAALLATIAVMIGLLSGWPSVMPSIFGYLAAIVFSVGFTRIAVREARTRVEVERLAAELREANDRLRVYALQIEELATTEERNRLAREIHDGLGHYLTAISMQLQAARAVWGSDPARVADALGKAQTLAREALADVRRSVGALRASPAEERPLPEALAPLVEESRAAGLQAELTVNGAPRHVSAQAALALYRVAQEGLTNVCKHARASRVEIVLDYADASGVRLTVRDDGVGAQNTNGGFGLIGLRERVQVLGGELRIHTTDRQGFALEVKVPG